MHRGEAGFRKVIEKASGGAIQSKVKQSGSESREEHLQCSSGGRRVRKHGSCADSSLYMWGGQCALERKK